MVGSLGAQIGLLAFTIALLAGTLVGNTPTVVLLRALGALVIGAVVGQAAGWAAKQVLREYLQKRKSEIDRRHFAEMRLMANTADSAAPRAATEIGEVE
jgi:divalent metal cation (Fe/Co/Zn/Cd) transporter